MAKETEKSAADTVMAYDGLWAKFKGKAPAPAPAPVFECDGFRPEFIVCDGIRAKLEKRKKDV